MYFPCPPIPMDGYYPTETPATVRRKITSGARSSPCLWCVRTPNHTSSECIFNPDNSARSPPWSPSSPVVHPYTHQPYPHHLAVSPPYSIPGVYPLAPRQSPLDHLYPLYSPLQFLPGPAHTQQCFHHAPDSPYRQELMTTPHSSSGVTPAMSHLSPLVVDSTPAPYGARRPSLTSTLSSLPGNSLGLDDSDDGYSINSHSLTSHDSESEETWFEDDPDGGYLIGSNPFEGVPISDHSPLRYQITPHNIEMSPWS
ncbi:hypothetical protein BDQ12DRAFT_689548 [Crucibulum laeve]|uniref:Uncharacterized protein n=1 Tax=Crucibulum laeve TaxID=68775 RepID=A0A5C3LP63_9AGAR|nr:hypothetical protein BDQ12DRAFT_689548 [Crucibulum laeve]